MFISSSSGSINSSLNPFHDLTSGLEHRGFIPSDNSKSDFFIGINHNKRTYKEFISQGGSSDRAALIRLEPPSVFPAQYGEAIQEYYGIVMTLGSLRGISNKSEFLCWPYVVVANPQKPLPNEFTLNQHRLFALEHHLSDFNSWLNRKNEIVLIAANKVSPAREEQYSTRRKYARNLQAHQLKIYGEFWNESLLKQVEHRARVLIFSLRNGYFPNLKNLYGNLHWRYPSAQGPIAEKKLALENSRFSLVIENDSSYVSEKLFDAMMHGTIPIYLGPDLSLTGIPSNVLIELNQSPAEIWNYVCKLDEKELFAIWQNIRSFLSSELNLKRWDKAIVYGQIANQLTNHFESLKP